MKKLVLISTVFLMMVSYVNAVPVQWTIENGGNGHYYEYVSSEYITWSEASTAAQNSTLMETNGHLATLTSQTENDFVYSLLSGTNSNIVHLGGYQEANATEPDDGWNWVTSEAWNWTNWAYDQPSNTDGVEDKLAMWGTDSSDSLKNAHWNDVRDNNPGINHNDGYVVEYSIPEPVSLVFLLAGSLMLRKKS